jgi:hypothetical protein
VRLLGRLWPGGDVHLFTLLLALDHVEQPVGVTVVAPALVVLSIITLALVRQ